MIHIERDPAIPAVAVYADKSAKALDGTTKVTRAVQELEKAIAYHTDPAHFKNDEKITKKRSFSFRVYKDPKLVEELGKIFLGKCAYCESRYGAVTPKDIEHFRPKSEIDNGSKKVQPGYYWLASDWHNLLVSCPECNRPRKHKVPGQSKKVTLGKGSQFPLDGEALRVRHHNGNVADEEPARLLLNPCVDHPEEHLTFDEDGLVHPKTVGGAPSKKGRFSIDIYALQRWDLVQERLRVLNDLRFQLDQARHLAMIQNALIAAGSPDSVLVTNLNQLEAVKAKVKELLAASAPYLGMLREWVHGAKQAGEFDTLLQFGIDPEALI